MRVILDIDEKYAGLISLTCVGSTAQMTYASANAFATENGTHIKLDNNGHFTQEAEHAE
mgnify:CR=1 FL=1